jgi:hypothetical protein
MMQMPVQQRPLPASTALSEFAVSPSDRSAFATLAGPHIDGRTNGFRAYFCLADDKGGAASQADQRQHAGRERDPCRRS